MDDGEINMILVFLLVGGCGVFFIFGGSCTCTCTSTNNNPSENQQEANLVTAEEIRQAYQDNQMAAESKYQNKLSIVVGEVDGIQKINDKDFFVVVRQDERSFFCIFSISDQKSFDTAMKLNKGEFVCVQGILEVQREGRDVRLQKCSFGDKAKYL